MRESDGLATLGLVKLENILDSLFLEGGFSPDNFQDLFYPITIAALVFLVATVVLYNVQSRRLRHHPPLVNLQEWLFWTGLSVFGLLLVYAIFKFYFVFVLLTLIVGIGTMVWIRFYRFPPLILAYNSILRREQYLSQKRYATADSTIRSKGKSRPKTKPKSKKKKR
jgi:small-conductance mechanosensitive channel